MRKRTYAACERQPWLLSTFFQWQFLIRSDQYKAFYENSQIDFLISEERRLSIRRDELLREVEETKDYLSVVEYRIHNDFDKGELDKDEPEDRKQDKVIELEKHIKELKAEITSVGREHSKVHRKAGAIRKEAEKRFKIRTDFRNLKPERDLLPNDIFFVGIRMPLFGIAPNAWRKMSGRTKDLYGVCVQQISYIGELSGILERSYRKLNADGTLREVLFEVDTHYPHSFLVHIFSEKLKKIMGRSKMKDAIQEDKDAKKRRKEWGQWKEALEVYDLCETVKKSYGGRDYLLETARQMVKKHPTDAYWQEKPQLSDRIRKKYKVAKKFIRLAGDGELIAAID